MPVALLVLLIVLAVAGGLAVGYFAAQKRPVASQPARKGIGERARDTATKGVLSLWRWNRARKKRAREQARDGD